MLADDLDEDSWAWLRQSQRREARIFSELFGLEVEIRAEGVAALDRRDELTDEAFPRTGTLGHAALLVVSELARRLRPEATQGDGLVTTVAVPGEMMEDVVAGIHDRHGRRWRQEYIDRPDRLRPDVEDLLVSMGLLRRAGDGRLHLAAVANRYAPEVIEAPPNLTFDNEESS